MYERRQRYADNRMANNKKITTLTEEQHDAISTVCSLRHDFHSNYDDMFNHQAANDELWQLFPSDVGKGKINELLSDVELSEIIFSVNIASIPTDFDYYELLTTEEKEKTSFSDWKEESGDYGEFCECMNKLNADIESYLKTIDDEHGTNYCPSGANRL